MATYVEITREEMEGFLKEIARDYRTQPKRSQGTEGVYLLPFSKTVALRISTSIGSRGTVVSKGKGAIHLALVSLVTKKPLATKAMKEYIGQTRVNRTQGWKKTLKKAVSLASRAYIQRKEFFDRISLGKEKSPEKNPEEQQTILTKIESFPQWEDSRFLLSIHTQVSEGRILSRKQKDSLDSILSKKTKNKTDDHEKYLKWLRLLYSKAKKENNRNDLNFLESVGKQLASGKNLSQKQKEVVEKINQQYRIKKVAKLWLSY